MSENKKKFTRQLFSQKPKEEKSSMSSPNKLKLLFTVVERPKTEFYVDLLQGYEINMQMVLHATGTAKGELLGLLGLIENEKSVIISVIKAERENESMSTLANKFTTVRNGKGIAYTVPMTSMIGVAIYQFLSNTSNGGIG